MPPVQPHRGISVPTLQKLYAACGETFTWRLYENEEWGADRRFRCAISTHDDELAAAVHGRSWPAAISKAVEALQAPEPTSDVPNVLGPAPLSAALQRYIENPQKVAP